MKGQILDNLYLPCCQATQQACVRQKQNQKYLVFRIRQKCLSYMLALALPSAGHHQVDLDFVGNDDSLHFLFSLTPVRGQE